MAANTQNIINNIVSEQGKDQDVVLCVLLCPIQQKPHTIIYKNRFSWWISIFVLFLFSQIKKIL